MSKVISRQSFGSVLGSVRVGISARRVVSWQLGRPDGGGIRCHGYCVFVRYFRSSIMTWCGVRRCGEVVVVVGRCGEVWGRRQGRLDSVSGRAKPLC